MVFPFDLELLAGISFLAHKRLRLSFQATLRVNGEGFSIQNAHCGHSAPALDGLELRDFLLGYGYSIAALVVRLRTRMGKRKWLWSVISLLGVGQLSINWITGQSGFTPIPVLLPVAGRGVPVLTSKHIKSAKRIY
jgi:hypothetical protein